MATELEYDSADEAEHKQFKLILLGDGAVGKTSIAQRFAHDHFATAYKQTIGVDFLTGHIKLPGAHGGIRVARLAWGAGGGRTLSWLTLGGASPPLRAGDVHVTLQIWDIGGQSIGSKMITRYINGAKVRSAVAAGVRGAGPR